MQRSSLGKLVFAALLLAIIVPGCTASKKLTVRATAQLVEDVAKATSKQSDLQIVEKGMPAYLMLLDRMVEAAPDNAPLLLAAGQSYASYASAFVESQDRDYARALYKRARDYTFKALETRGLSSPASIPFEAFESRVAAMGLKDVPYLFWCATNWGNWIAQSLESMEAMAQLPRVELMMRRVLALDEAYYYGGPHLFMGIWYASRPTVAGGNLVLSQEHFSRALTLAKHHFLMASVYYADYYARKTFDKALYVETLQKVLETPADIVPELTLLNSAAHARARKMLQEADAYFE